MMVHGRVGAPFLHKALMHATYQIFPCLPIKGLLKDGCPSTPFEIFYRHKPKIGHLCFLFCPCVAKKLVAHQDGHPVAMQKEPQRVGTKESTLECRIIRTGTRSGCLLLAQ